MSDKTKWPWADADLVAKSIVAQLAFYCERIEAVGSVRRRKPHVGDVEVLFIPRLEDRQTDMFSTEPYDLAHERIETLRATGWLAKRLNVNGMVAGWGPKNKLAVHVESGMPVDLFSTTPSCWFSSLVCRTGGKDTNLALTNGANKLNRTWHVYGEGVEDRKTGLVTAARSEREVFELCGVPYLEPEERR